MTRTVYSFSCAQSDEREHKAKVPKGKNHDTERMERFPCHRWLHITILEGQEMIIKLKHLHHHVAYISIGLPNHWKTWIEANATQMLPGQVSEV
jgi:kynurenine formamidase